MLPRARNPVHIEPTPLNAPRPITDPMRALRPAPSERTTAEVSAGKSRERGETGGFLPKPDHEAVERFISRVSSLVRLPFPGGDHSSARHYPGWDEPPLASEEDGALFGLAPSGVCHAVPVTRHPVRSYRTFSPLPTRASAVRSLWHCPAGHPDLRFASTLLFGARTFLDLRPFGPKTAEPDRDHLVLSTASFSGPPWYHECGGSARHPCGRSSRGCATGMMERMTWLVALLIVVVVGCC